MTTTSWQPLAQDLQLTLPSSMATDDPFVLLLRSTMCTLCSINQNYFVAEEQSYPDIPIKIIDTTHDEFKVLNLQLFSIPTAVLVRNQKVVHYKEGVLNHFEVQEYLKAASKLIQD